MAPPSSATRQCKRSSHGKFEPDPDQAHPTLGRVRALIRYKADMSTEVALAPAILPDAFGDRGTPRNEEAEAAFPPLQCGN